MLIVIARIRSGRYNHREKSRWVNFSEINPPGISV